MAVGKTIAWTVGGLAILACLIVAARIPAGQQQPVSPIGPKIKLPPTPPQDPDSPLNIRKNRVPPQPQPTPGEQPPLPGQPTAVMSIVPGLDAMLPKMGSIIPLPEEPIPDSPPPHEGAMMNLNHRVAPPDLVTIEVLEALPGRPISGERLVRPDGTITLGFYGNLFVDGLTCTQIKEKVILRLRTFVTDESLGLVAEDPNTGKVLPVLPANSDRVFVDIAQYNSAVYSIHGDVNSPGRLPWTGNETVRDALIYAGGLDPLADPKTVRVVRPARGGQPAKVYPIDLDAIEKRGDKTANLQIFPGDRLVVDRSAAAEASLKMSADSNRLTPLLNNAAAYLSAVRKVDRLGGDDANATADFSYKIGKKTLQIRFGDEKAKLDPARRKAILKDWRDLWEKNAKTTGPEEKRLLDEVVKTLDK